MVFSKILEANADNCMAPIIRLIRLLLAKELISDSLLPFVTNELHQLMLLQFNGDNAYTKSLDAVLDFNLLSQS